MHRKGTEAIASLPEQGDSYAAFGKLVEAYRSRVYHTAYGIIQNPEDAKDITQEVFLKIFKNLDTFKGEAKLSTWIYRVTVNTCIDMLRKRKLEPHVPLREGINNDGQGGKPPAISHAPTSPFQATYHAELQVKIREAFLKLSPEHRTTLVLREIEGLSYGEIAELLSCSVGTVMSRLHYGRKKMQKLLAPIWEGNR